MRATVRPGWWLLAATGLAASLLGCGDDGGDGGDDRSDAPAETTPATLPEQVEPGRGAMVIDRSNYALTVRSCTLEPTTDPATGVTTELAIDADDGVGTSVSVTRSTTEAAQPTTTETILVADTSGSAMVANRAEVGGRFLDLLAEGAVTPMLTVEGDVVRGAGVLGPQGARPGDPLAVEVQILLSCPPGD